MEEEGRSTGEGLLRRALRANAIFSGASGVGLLVGAGPLSGFLGVGKPWVLFVVGLSLVAFAAGLLRNASRASIDRREAWTAAYLDVAWVVGSVLLLAFAPGLLSNAGKWTVAVVADVVGILAALQLYALWRMRARGPLQRGGEHGTGR